MGFNIHGLRKKKWYCDYYQGVVEQLLALIFWLIVVGKVVKWSLKVLSIIWWFVILLPLIFNDDVLITLFQLKMCLLYSILFASFITFERIWQYSLKYFIKTGFLFFLSFRYSTVLGWQEVWMPNIIQKLWFIGLLTLIMGKLE